MRNIRNNKGLLDKRRFAIWEKEKKLWLRNLSLRRALKLEEILLSSQFIWLWRKNFLVDTPLCLKDSLKKKS